jgi:ubiquinone biosynthesis monooxygenase Coq6
MNRLTKNNRLYGFSLVSKYSTNKHYDICVVGGGMVGTAFACGVAKSPYADNKRIALIESGDLIATPQSIKDVYSNRVSSITPATKDYMTRI